MTGASNEGQLLVVDEIRHGPASVLRVAGELDMHSGPQLRAALSEILERPGVDAVVVDLTAVTFLGSTGIAVLVDADWEARQRAKHLRLVVGDARAVSRSLASTGIENLLDQYPDLGSALRDPHA